MKKAAKFILRLVILTAVCHTAEWFVIGRKVAADAGMSSEKAFPQCFLKGFFWWIPLKKKLAVSQKG